MKPKTVKLIQGEGMPIHVRNPVTTVIDSDPEDEHQPAKKGNLYIQFDIKFPSSLNES